MNPGTLNRRITIQQLTTGKDDEGFPTESWNDFYSCWAAVEPLKGREYFQAAAFNAENTVRFRIRYRSGIKPDMRIVYDKRVFDIISVIDINEAHKEIHLMAKELVGGE
jgi:SPP1 family predicted phage head-tail adaptor